MLQYGEATEMTHRIMGFDLGTQTGWATWNGRTWKWGSWDLTRGEKHTHHGQRFREFERRADKALDLFRPTLVVYEDTVQSKGHGMEVAKGLRGVLLARCEAREVPYAPVPIGTWKAFTRAPGGGNATKDAVREALQTWWQSVFTHEQPAPAPDIEQDAVDALWVTRYAIEQQVRQNEE
jgi:hypothetical protein